MVGTLPFQDDLEASPGLCKSNQLGHRYLTVAVFIERLSAARCSSHLSRPPCVIAKASRHQLWTFYPCFFVRLNQGSRNNCLLGPTSASPSMQAVLRSLICPNIGEPNKAIIFEGFFFSFNRPCFGSCFGFLHYLGMFGEGNNLVVSFLVYGKCRRRIPDWSLPVAVKLLLSTPLLLSNFSAIAEFQRVQNHQSLITIYAI